MITLGSKIKNKRKQLKLTLKELAGEDISYSMLSQIENDKAKPSMDTLEIIAAKLGVHVSELINTVDFEKLRSILKEVEQLSNMPFERDVKIDVKIVEMIEDISKDLPEDCYEGARLKELYVKSTYYINGKLNEEQLSKVINYYEHAGLFASKLKAKLFKSKCFFDNLNYEQAFKELEFILQEVEHLQFSVDQLTIADIYYYSSVINAALGNYSEALLYVEKWLFTSHSNNVYIKMDAFYRLIVILFLQQGDNQSASSMLEKYNKYIDFTENIYEEANYYYLKFHYDNRTNNDAKVVEENIRVFMRTSKKHNGFTLSTLFDQELAYSLWAQGKFISAVELLINLKIPEYVKHPLDLSACYEIFAIRALCHLELGNFEDALEDIVFSHQQMKAMPTTIYKNFVRQAYLKIIALSK